MNDTQRINDYWDIFFSDIRKAAEKAADRKTADTIDLGEHGAALIPYDPTPVTGSTIL